MVKALPSALVSQLLLPGADLHADGGVLEEALMGMKILFLFEQRPT